MRHLATFLLLAVLSCIGLGAAEKEIFAQDKPVDVKDMEKAWHAREQRVKSISVAWKTKQTYIKGSMIPPGVKLPVNPKNLVVPPEDFTYEGSYSLKMEGNKVSYQYTRQIWSMNEEKFVERSSTRLFDGEKNSTLTTGNKTASAGSIGPQAYPVPLMYDETRAIALAVRMSVLPSNIFELERLRVSPVSPTFEGARCIGLVDKKTFSSYLIDPTKDYSFVQWTEQNRTTGLTRTRLDIDLENHNGLWLPKSWHLERFMPDGSLGDDTVAFNVSYQLDVALASNELEMKYPPKTLIVESGERNKSGPKLSVITTEGTKLPISHEQLRKIGFEELTTPRTISSSLILWTTVAVLLVAGIVCAVLFRKRLFLFKGEKQ